MVSWCGVYDAKLKAPWLPTPKVNDEEALLLRAVDTVAEKSNELFTDDVPKATGVGAGFASVACDEGAPKEKLVEGLLPKAKVDDDDSGLELIARVVVAVVVGPDMAADAVLDQAVKVVKERGDCGNADPKVSDEGGAAAGGEVDTACVRDGTADGPNADALGVVSPSTAGELPKEKGVWVLLVSNVNTLEAFGNAASDDEASGIDKVEMTLTSSPGFPKSVEGLGVYSACDSRFQFDAMMPSNALGVKLFPKADPFIDGIC